MLITIVDRFAANGTQFFEWTLNDGPDGIEEVHGYATDLITTFSKLIEWRERIAADYANDTTDNETNESD
jgi:hypothetical protein